VHLRAAISRKKTDFEVSFSFKTIISKK